MKGIIPSTSDGILQILFGIFGMGFLYAGIVCAVITTLILIMYLISFAINSAKGQQNNNPLIVIKSNNTRALRPATAGTV
jgi:TM2 domain-containing membrane protein YozV